MAKFKFNFKKIGMKAAGVGAGVVAGKLSNRVMPDSWEPWLKGSLKIVAGAIAPELVSGKSKAFVEDMGAGLMATGASELVDAYIPMFGAEPTVEGIGNNLYDEDEGYTTDSLPDVSGLGDEKRDAIISGPAENEGSASYVP